MADESYKSGTRLKIRFYEGGDGSKQFAGWFDSVKAEPCGFHLHGDGTTRCLPSDALIQTNLFGDAGCTVPIVTRPASTAAAPKYVLTRASNGGLNVAALGGQFSTPSYSGGPGNCLNAGPLPGQNAWNIGNEIAGSDFVEATIKTVP